MLSPQMSAACYNMKTVEPNDAEWEGKGGGNAATAYGLHTSSDFSVIIFGDDEREYFVTAMPFTRRSYVVQ